MHFARDKNKEIWDMSFGTDAFLELCELCNPNESLFDVNGEHFVKTPTIRVMKLFKEHPEQDLLEGAFTAGDGIDALASINADGNRVTLTAANRNLYDSATLTLCPELREMNIVMSDIVNTKNVRAYNSPDHPEEITQHPFEAASPELTLPPHSVIRVVFTK